MSSFLLLLFVQALFAGQSEQSPPSESELEPRLEQIRKLLDQSKDDEALAAFRLVLPDLRRSGDFQLLANHLNRMSLAVISLGDYDLGLEWGLEALESSRESGDSEEEAHSYNNLGLASLYQGDYSSAHRYYKSALALDRLADDTEGEVLRLNNIANVFYYQGRYFEALNRYLEALKALDSHPDAEWKKHEYLRTKANLAVLYQKLGQNQRALQIYLNMGSSRELLTPSEEGRVLLNLGVLYRRLGDPMMALETYERAREKLLEGRHSSAEIGVWRNIGIVYALDLQELEKARTTFERVISLSSDQGNRRMQLHGFLYLGEVERRLSNLDRAEEFFSSALKFARELGAVEELWKAHFGMGQIKQSRGDFEGAEVDFQEALQQIESVRARIKASSLRPGFLADKRDVYDSLFRLYLQKMEAEGKALDPEYFFSLLERAKARTIQDQLGSSVERSAAVRKPDTARALKELRQQISSQLNTELTSSGSEGMSTGRLQLEQELLELETELYEDFKGFSETQESLAKLGALLGPNQAILDFWINDDLAGVIYLLDSDSGVVVQPLGSEFQVEFKSCLSALRTPANRPIQEGCSEVSSRLIGGIVETIPDRIDSLIIIPDRDLALLPFEAMKLLDGRFLTESYRVTYLPSAGFLRISTSPTNSGLPWQRSLLAFAGTESTGRGELEDESEATLLPFSIREVQSISRLLPGRKTVFMGSEAKKSVLTDPNREATPLIHLSTHAVADLMVPERSRMLFSPDDEDEGDSYLLLGEVLDLDLNGTSLVTLSACDTAVGKMTEGEAISSFSSSLLLTGASSSLTTLWKVEDEATFQFMEQFYYELARGLTKAEALRAAKIRFLHSKSEYSHPFYWAAFVLYGDGDSSIPLPYSWRATGIAVSATVLALTLLVLAFLRIRRST